MPQQNPLRWRETASGVKEIAFDDDDDNANLNNDENLFDSLVILEFSPKVPPPAIQWILEKIKLAKSKGGSELLTCPIMDDNREVDPVQFLLQTLSSFSFIVIKKW